MEASGQGLATVKGAVRGEGGRVDKLSLNLEYQEELQDISNKSGDKYSVPEKRIWISNHATLEKIVTDMRQNVLENYVGETDLMEKQGEMLPIGVISEGIALRKQRTGN